MTKKPKAVRERTLRKGSRIFATRRIKMTKKPKKTLRLIEPVTCLSDLAAKAKEDEAYQRLAIVALRNLGCEHLADSRRSVTKYGAYVIGLYSYWSSLVGEYGIDEDQAEDDVVDEVNHVRDCIDQADLNW